MWFVAAFFLTPVVGYGLWTLFVMLRLRLEVPRLERECRQRGFGLAWSYFVVFPVDLWDPVLLEVVVSRGERRLSFSVWRSLLSDWTFLRVRVSPLALGKRLRGALFIEPRDRLWMGTTSLRLGRGELAVRELDLAEVDSAYRLCVDLAAPNGPEELALVRHAFARSDALSELAAYRGRIELRPDGMEVAPACGGLSFFDGLDRVARLADALDGAVASAAPYR